MRFITIGPQGGAPEHVTAQDYLKTIQTIPLIGFFGGKEMIRNTVRSKPLKQQAYLHFMDLLCPTVLEHPLQITGRDSHVVTMFSDWLFEHVASPHNESPVVTFRQQKHFV